MTELSEWLILNGLTGDRAQLIHSRLREMFFLHPSGRWFAPAAVAPLLAAGYLEQRGLTPGVYRLSECGRARQWTLGDGPEVAGICDRCARIRRVRPRPLGEGHELLCEACRVAAMEGADVIETAYSPALV